MTEQKIDVYAKDNHSEIIESLSAKIGHDQVVSEAPLVTYAYHDIFFEGTPPSCVAVPRSKSDVVTVVREAAAHGYALVPRGGGMSYTRGYLADATRAIALDLGELNRVVSIDEENLTVTAECGCTWKTLYEELAKRGLRVPAFGTMSGHNATVGGGLSQGSIFYGSTRYGTSADMVTGLEVVLADGSLGRTGQSATGEAKPFFRYYGPDLTGNFLGDGGALGIKVEATLRLIPSPAHVGTASFAFEDFESAWKTQTDIARAGLAAEVFSFDAILQHQLMERNSLIDNVAALRNVVTSGGNLLKGVRDAMRVVKAGKQFMNDAPYTVHVVAEERHKPSLDASLSEISTIATDLGGRKIPDSIPSVMRAQPFGNMDMTLGPSGERWVPVHGLVALSDGLEAMKKVQEFLRENGERLVEHKILVGILSMVVAPSVFVLEALFYWPDAPSPLHDKVVSNEKLAQGKRYPENPAARALVAEMRTGFAEVLAPLGAAHLGAGRIMPYRQRRDPNSFALLQAIKDAVDPSGIMNPGVLGLGVPGSRSFGS